MSEPTPIDAIAAAAARLDDVRREVARVYVGPAAAVDRMAMALLARGHVLLEGVPGVAKTTLVKAFATAVGCSVRRIQFTADLLPSDIIGTYVLSPRDGSFALREGPVFAEVVLADEINRAPAKTQAALLEAMQERQVTIEGVTHPLPSPFFVLATQNPVDLEGTYPLPEAELDRFLLRVSMGYPTHRDEIAMLRVHGQTPPAPRPVLAEGEVVLLQRLAATVHVDDDLLDYAVTLVAATRAHPQVALGASPRATLGLVQAARAAALLAARPYVTPDDLRDLAVPVLAHRLVLVPEAEDDASARERTIAEVVDRVAWRRAPRKA